MEQAPENKTYTIDENELAAIKRAVKLGIKALDRKIAIAQNISASRMPNASLQYFEEEKADLISFLNKYP